MTDTGAEGTHSHDDDPREEVIEAEPRAGHAAANIREEQGTHAAGAVPAAYVGGEQPGDKPEDSADNSGHWDAMGRENPVKEPQDEER